MNRAIPREMRIERLEEYVRAKRRRISQGVLAGEAARLFELIAEAEEELRRLRGECRH